MSLASEHAEQAVPAAFTGKLPVKVKALFATGDIVDGTINFGVGVFLFYYLTAVCGMSGSTAGAILGISIIIDAIADPFIGSITDNTRSRLGRRLPYLIGAGLPTALGFGLLFSIPHLDPGWMLATYAGVVLLILRLSTSFFFLPYASLSAELTSDYTERSMIVVWRTFYNCVGNILLLVLGYWVFMRGREGLLDHQAYVGFGWSIAAIALTASLLSAYGAMPQLSRLRQNRQAASPGFRQLARELNEIGKAPSFWCLFLSTLLFWTSTGIGTTLGIHANLYFWRLPEDVVATLPLVNIAGFIAGLPLSTWLSRRFEKRSIAIGGLILTAVTLVLPAPLQIAVLLPAGDPLYVILAAFTFMTGVVGTCMFVAWGSMMSDAVDEHELLFGARREGLYFAGLLVSIKAAVGIGGFLAGVSLDIIGFPADLLTIDPNTIPQGVINELGIVQGPVAAIVALAGVLLLSRYRIDRKELARIQAALAARDT